MGQTHSKRPRMTLAALEGEGYTYDTQTRHQLRPHSGRLCIHDDDEGCSPPPYEPTSKPARPYTGEYSLPRDAERDPQPRMRNLYYPPDLSDGDGQGKGRSTSSRTPSPELPENTLERLRRYHSEGTRTGKGESEGKSSRTPSPVLPENTLEMLRRYHSEGTGKGKGKSTSSYTPSPENVLEMLRKYHIVFVIDDSKSMLGMRWHQARDALSVLVEESARYAVDGIDVHFFNDERASLNLTTAAGVRSLFDAVVPRGITPMGEKLESLLLRYLAALERAKDLEEAGDAHALRACKPVNFIVITDGAPTDDPEAVIVAAAKRLDARNFPITQVGIQFVQIGDSPVASAFLRQLDEGLAAHHGIRDMVDTTPYADLGTPLSAPLLTKILLGGINRRIDRCGVGGLFFS